MQHHYGYAIVIFTSFLTFQFLHAWVRASLSIQSKLNGIQNYSQYVQLNAPVLVTRFALAALLLMAWGADGEQILGAIAPYLPEWMSWLSKNPLPLNPVSAGVYGFFGDAALDGLVGMASRKWPGLKKEIPPAPEDNDGK